VIDSQPPSGSSRPLIAVAALLGLFFVAALVIFEFEVRGSEVGATSSLVALLRLPTLNARTRFSIDAVAVGSQSYTVTGVQPKIEVPAGATLVVSGWAIDEAARLPGKAVLLRLDEGPRIVARYGLARDDVAKALDSPALAPSGFEATVPTAGLRPGQHELTLEIANAAGTGVYRVPKRIEFIVTPQPKGAVLRLRTFTYA
jgi:hypothetical protein